MDGVYSPSGALTVKSRLTGFAGPIYVANTKRLWASQVTVKLSKHTADETNGRGISIVYIETPHLTK
jgi:hypothetical protein